MISILAKAGELERYKGIHNRVGWNPDVTNRMKWTRFNSQYAGKSIFTYNDLEKDIKLAMETLSNVSEMPRDLEDFEHTIEIEDKDVLKEEIKSLKEQVAELQAFKVFCQEKFKADEIKDWFQEHGLVDLSKKPVL